MIKCLMSSEFPCFTHPRIRGRDLPMPRSQPEFPLSVSPAHLPQALWFGLWVRGAGLGTEGMDLSSVHLYEILLSTPLHAQPPALL